MRQRCLPSKDTLEAKSLTFTPPDPAWAPLSAVQRARAALRAYDPYLNLWWSPAVRMGDPVRPGRWTVKAWMPTLCNWDTVLVWEGPHGEYRDEFPTDKLIAAVAALALNGERYDRRVGLRDSAIEGGKAKATKLREQEDWREANHKARYDSGAVKGIPVPGQKK